MVDEVVKIMSRKEAKLLRVPTYYDGKGCKWNHNTTRVTSSGLCSECTSIMEDKGIIGETFESIMKTWDSTSHKAETKRLPYLSGTSNMGYKVRGFTYVSEDWYDVCSRVLWVKSSQYVVCSLSKDNCARLNVVRGKGKTAWIRLHRFVKGLGESKMIPDHINGFGLDNRTTNLRVASVADNSHNCKPTKNTTGYIGVDYITTAKWSSHRARLFRNGKRFLCKCYPTAEIAAQAYDDCLRENFPSEFNVYNFKE